MAYARATAGGGNQAKGYWRGEQLTFGGEGSGMGPKQAGAGVLQAGQGMVSASGWQPSIFYMFVLIILEMVAFAWLARTL